MQITRLPRDLGGDGTPESTWAACAELAGAPQWDPKPPPTGRVIVVAPHPDDELLGVGGTTALLANRGARVELVAVTEGERSHPGRADHLRTVRPEESRAAAGRLGVSYRPVYRLEHPDGGVDEPTLARQLDQILSPADLVLAPWWGDGHPDHDATGRACAVAAAGVGATLVEYLVWAWHWARPEDLPWARARRVELGAVAVRKQQAAACFASQIVGDPVILPPRVLRRLLRQFELVLFP